MKILIYKKYNIFVFLYKIEIYFLFLITHLLFNLNLPLFISKRYLFSKKSTNVINIISGIAITGVAFGTMALFVILSVFNGFDSLIRSLLNSFDPDLKITIVEGKTFSADTSALDFVKQSDDVAYFVEVIEENVLLESDDKQHIATMKGVGNNFPKINGIDTMIIDGEFVLRDDEINYAVLGYGISYKLSYGLNSLKPIKIWIPKRKGKVTFDPQNAFNKDFIFASAIFSVQQDYDDKYIIVPIKFARNLLDYKTEVSSIEIKLKDGVNKRKVEKEIQEKVGEGFYVKNRFEQQELLYKIMKSEKWAIFLILTFILIIASFNVVGSLTMLIIDKKKDIEILRNIGASNQLIRNIFLIEGWLISVIGAIVGLLLGSLLCYLQLEFSLLQFPGAGTFIVNAYPVEMRLLDLVFVFLTVITIGFIAVWYPVKYIKK